MRFVGGGGADCTLTGGAGANNNFIYASASESQPSGFDTITNFNVAMDKIDLVGLGPTVLAFQASQLGGGSVDRQADDSLAAEQGQAPMSM